MSMQSYTTTGYGFSPEKIKETKLLSFLKNHVNSITDEKIRNAISLLDLPATLKKLTENPTIRLNDDLPDTYPELANILEPFINNDFFEEYLPSSYKTIADIITKETNIHMEYFQGQEDCIGEEGYIMLPASMPWNFNLREKSITENNLFTTLAKYTEELGLAKTEIGSCEIEYFG